MKSLFAILVLTLFSATSFAADKPAVDTPAGKHAEKIGPQASMNRKIASEEVKCSANPNELGIDPEFIEKQIANATSCYQASHIASSCGAGSSLDNMITDPAIKLCDKLAGKLSKSDADLKKRMNTRCEKVCDPQTEGTLCISQQAFCRLDVSKFLNSVNSK